MPRATLTIWDWSEWNISQQLVTRRLIPWSPTLTKRCEKRLSDRCRDKKTFLSGQCSKEKKNYAWEINCLYFLEQGHIAGIQRYERLSNRRLTWTPWRDETWLNRTLAPIPKDKAQVDNWYKNCTRHQIVPSLSVIELVDTNSWDSMLIISGGKSWCGIRMKVDRV